VSSAAHPDLLTRVQALFSWHSLAVLIWIAGSLIAGAILSLVTRFVLRRLAARTTHTWDDAIVARLGGPLTMGWALAIGYVALSLPEMSAAAETTARHVLKGSFIATIFWVLLRSIDVADHLVTSSAWASQRLSSRSFVALGGKVLKIAIVVIGAVTILSQAGYPVGSLIAGLGIGGLAFALAAQKTVENVFGAFSIAVDEPFRHGDLVKIDTVMGTIESIGLRSTRIRTLDRTIVAIPNGKLAEMRTETFAVRDRLRLACTVSLVYQTTAEQMRRVLAEVESALRAHPKIVGDTVSVCFKEMSASSLDIDVAAYFATTDWNEFQVIRQGVLLQLMQIVEGAGTAFAFPTRTVQLLGTPPESPPRPRS
jgi:MscS family membrane protein